MNVRRFSFDVIESPVFSMQLQSTNLEQPVLPAVETVLMLEFAFFAFFVLIRLMSWIARVSKVTDNPRTHRSDTNKTVR